MILVVDDDTEFLQEAQRVLAQVSTGGVLFAHGAARAVFLLTQLKGDISVALIGLDMRTTDGVKLIAELRRDYPELPMIAVGNARTHDLLDKAKQSGASEVLEKPIAANWVAVVERIRRAESRAAGTGPISS